MLIKLTYYGKSKPTLVNLNNVETIYQVADKYQQKLSTKIVFKGGNYVNVEEDLQTILGLQNDVLSGEYQSTKWDSPSVDELLENEYNKRTNDRPRYNKQDYRNDHFANRY